MLFDCAKGASRRLGLIRATLNWQAHLNKPASAGLCGGPRPGRSSWRQKRAETTKGDLKIAKPKSVLWQNNPDLAATV
jgi:hypothetical protein